jgi:hypothetical protein
MAGQSSVWQCTQQTLSLNCGSAPQRSAPSRITISDICRSPLALSHPAARVSAVFREGDSGRRLSVHMSQRQTIGIDDPIPAGDWLKSPWAREAALRHGCEDKLRRRWRSIRDTGHAQPGWRPNADTQDLGSCGLVPRGFKSLRPHHRVPAQAGIEGAMCPPRREAEWPVGPALGLPASASVRAVRGAID